MANAFDGGGKEMKQKSKTAENEEENGISYWLIISLAVVSLLIIALFFSGTALQHLNSLKFSAQYPAPGKVVNGTHFYCIGGGEPVVLLFADYGEWSIHLLEVQKGIAEETMVCAFDRPGLGWSRQIGGERTNEIVVEELRSALGEAGIRGPYILAGHGWGGQNAAYFAHEYPEESAGVVLIDMLPPERFGVLPEEFAGGWRKRGEAYRWNAVLARHGWGAFIEKEQRANATERMQEIERLKLLQFETWQGMHYEWMGAEKSNNEIKQIMEGRGLEDVSLVVIGSGRHAGECGRFCGNLSVYQFNQRWREMQEGLQNLSKDNIVIITYNSAHEIPKEQPGLVSEAIIRLVKQERY